MGVWITEQHGSMEGALAWTGGPGGRGRIARRQPLFPAQVASKNLCYICMQHTYFAHCAVVGLKPCISRIRQGFGKENADKKKSGLLAFWLCGCVSVWSGSKTPIPVASRSRADGQVTRCKELHLLSMGANVLSANV